MIDRQFIPQSRLTVYPENTTRDFHNAFFQGASDVRETPTDQIYNPICSACHACHDVTTGMPLPIVHILSPPTGKANSITPTEGTT